jgi:hypothetical protein
MLTLRAAIKIFLAAGPASVKSITQLSILVPAPLSKKKRGNNEYTKGNSE